MLKAAEIRRMTYDTAYRKGRSYFESGCVQELELEEEGREESIRIKSRVKGSGKKVYDTSILVSCDDEILNYDCTCPAAENYWGMCKHCAALALAFQAEQKKHHLKFSMEAGVRRGTTETLSRLLYRYSMKQSGVMNGSGEGKVKVEFFFQTDKNGLLLECRIGDRRKYVVKNLVKLVRDVEEVRSCRYGAALSFVHTSSAFTERSREKLDLLTKAVASRFPDYQDAYYEASSNYRYLLLKNDTLELFLDYYLGRSINLQEREVPVKDQDPEVTLSMREVPGGAELTAEDADFYIGLQSVYVRKDGAIYRCSEEFKERVIPIWQAILKGQGGLYRHQPLFLSREDYGSFCGNILPVIENYCEIESGKLDLSVFAPAEAEFQIYLDMPEETVVEAAAKVRYDDEEYDLLLTSERGLVRGAWRNLAREAEVRRLIETYFPAEAPDAEKKEKKRGSRRRNIEWLDGLPVRDLDDPEDLDDESPVSDISPAAAGRCRRYAKGEEALFALADHGLEELSQAAELFVDESVQKLKVHASPKVTMGVGIAGELLDLSLTVEDMTAEEVSQILSSYRRKKKYHRLKNGEFLNLTEGTLGLLPELAEGLNLKDKEVAAGSVQIPLYRALYLDSVMKEERLAHVERSGDYRDLIRGIRQGREEIRPLPAGLHASLRRYQEEGVAWMQTLTDYGFGGILADDMGLGKTLQVITMLLERVSRPEKVPSSLVVAPASLLYNWENEVKRFAPELSVQIIAGSAPERREKIIAGRNIQINITSYDLLKRDIEAYEEESYDCCIIDEAQYIKNAGTQAAGAVKRIRAAHRIALTGTPIENRLSDLWSIFDFLMPGYLYSYSRFRSELETPIVKDQDEKAAKRLARMTAPFLLRRRKEDVLSDLPDKLEENFFVPMTGEQEELYQASVTELCREIAAKDEAALREDHIQILARLTRLRQICCSPELVFEDYRGGSGKVMACLELLSDAAESGHHVLVFSQFTSLLEILMREWKKTGEECLYLSGKDSKLKRQQMVDEFQKGKIPVFFISLKAGGTGLNLTAADMVIHCDPWWNAAAENQATDRAHRIGQRRVVNVMKLVARGSIEEKIMTLQEKKRALADSVVEGEGVRDYVLNREELLELFE